MERGRSSLASGVDISMNSTCSKFPTRQCVFHIDTSNSYVALTHVDFSQEPSLSLPLSSLAFHLPKPVKSRQIQALTTVLLLAIVDHKIVDAATRWSIWPL